MVLFISDINSPEELSRVILDLSKNPKKRFDIGQQGRIYANHHFSYSHIGKKLSNFFSIIIIKIMAKLKRN